VGPDSRRTVGPPGDNRFIGGPPEVALDDRNGVVMRGLEVGCGQRDRHDGDVPNVSRAFRHAQEVVPLAIPGLSECLFGEPAPDGDQSTQVVRLLQQAGQPPRLQGDGVPTPDRPVIGVDDVSVDLREIGPHCGECTRLELVAGAKQGDPSAAG